MKRSWRRPLETVLIGGTAVLFASTWDAPRTRDRGPVLRAAEEFVSAGAVATETEDSAATSYRPVLGGVTAEARTALTAFSTAVRGLSHPRALEHAVTSYYAFKAEHPEQIRKPYLYFVDYGLPNTAKRGWVLDMERKTVVEGPFTVAAGRGSSQSRMGIPLLFSNRHGSAATSLGLYVTQETYNFSGKAAGRFYRSIGLRMKGVSGEFNSNARTRGVVAHGAPYVTATRAGRSEGCPAVEEQRARRILPLISQGAVVFLFAPEQRWLSSDPWIAAASRLIDFATSEGDGTRG